MFTELMKDELERYFKTEKNGMKFVCSVIGIHNGYVAIDILAKHGIQPVYNTHNDYLPVYRESFSDKAGHDVFITDIFVKSERINFAEKLLKGLDSKYIVTRNNIDDVKVFGL